MQQANGDVRIGGTNIKLNADGSASFNSAATINSPNTQLILNRPGHSNWNIGNSSAGLFLNQDLQDGNGSKKRLVIAPESGPAAFGIAFSDRNEVETFRVEENGTVKALGIAFGAPSASATGRTLDDYEEGTSTVAYSTTGGVFSYSTGSKLIYTKVGNVVFCRLAIAAATSGGSLTPGTGEITITGLPFVVQPTGGNNTGFAAKAHIGVVHQGQNNSFNTEPFCVVPVAGTSTLKLKASNSTDAYMDATAFKSSTSVQQNSLMTEFWYNV